MINCGIKFSSHIHPLSQFLLHIFAPIFTDKIEALGKKRDVLFLNRINCRRWEKMREERERERRERERRGGKKSIPIELSLCENSFSSFLIHSAQLFSSISLRFHFYQKRVTEPSFTNSSSESSGFLHKLQFLWLIQNDSQLEVVWKKTNIQAWIEKMLNQGRVWLKWQKREA